MEKDWIPESMDELIKEVQARLRDLHKDICEVIENSEVLPGQKVNQNLIRNEFHANKTKIWGRILSATSTNCC